MFYFYFVFVFVFGRDCVGSGVELRIIGPVMNVSPRLE